MVRFDGPIREGGRPGGRGASRIPTVDRRMGDAGGQHCGIGRHARPDLGILTERRIRSLRETGGHGDLPRPNAWGHFADGTIAGVGVQGLSLRPEMVGKIVGSELRLARFAAGGKFLNEVARLPGRERYVVSTRGSLRWPFVPFSPDASYAISGTNVLSTSGREFVIEERDGAGSPVRRIRAEVPVHPVTSEHRANLAEQMRLNVRTEQDRVSTERYLAESPYPHNLPVISRLLPTRDAMLWVESYSVDAIGERRWWVLDRTGHWIGYASTPRKVRVLDVTSNRLLGIASDSLGVQSVLVYDLVPPRR